MPRALCLLLCLSAFASTQSAFAHSNTTSPSSAVQVVYAVNGTTLTTFNVDPLSLQATQVGTTTLHASISPGLVASPNGRFLYYTATTTDHRLYVYDTNASGVPASKPAQIVIANQLFGNLIVHPGGQFMYAVAVGPVYAGPTANYEIVRNLIDPNNGKISQPVTEASYNLPDFTSAGFCTLNILGFNPAGDTMYDDIFCIYPFNFSATYNQRSVNLQTGALGPDEQIFSWNDDGGIDIVQFQNNRLFDFSEPPEYQENTVTVYQAQIPLAQIVSCSASMLTACSDFQYGLAHPSGQYAFLIDPNGLTDVGQIDSTTQQIVQTATLPYSVQEFSPDGTIAYGVVGADIEITGFNVQNGQATAGGSISLTAAPDAWLAAQRY